MNCLPAVKSSGSNHPFMCAVVSSVPCVSEKPICHKKFRSIASDHVEAYDDGITRVRVGRYPVSRSMVLSAVRAAPLRNVSELRF